MVLEEGFLLAVEATDVASNIDVPVFEYLAVQLFGDDDLSRILE